MADNRKIKGWITINGRHIPVFEGQSKAEAFKQATGGGSKGPKLQGKAAKNDNKKSDRPLQSSGEKKSTSKKESGSNKSGGYEDPIARDAKKLQEDPNIAAKENWGNGYYHEVKDYLDSQKAKPKLGDDDKRVKKVDDIHRKNENRRIAEEAKHEESKGKRDWNPKQGDKINNVSHQQAENELFNAPVGTVIQMTNHNSGDYVGEYTKTENGWVGSQKYKSGYKKPSDAGTAGGFAMKISGNDVEVLKTGSGSNSFSASDSAKKINDISMAHNNQGGDKKNDWKQVRDELDKAPAGTVMIETGEGGHKRQFTKTEDGKWKDSNPPSSDVETVDSKYISMGWVGSQGHRSSVEFTTPDKAMTKDQLKESKDKAVSGKYNQALGLDKNDEKIGSRSVPKVGSNKSDDRNMPESSKKMLGMYKDSKNSPWYKQAKEVQVNGRTYKVWSDPVHKGTFAEDEDGNLLPLTTGGYLKNELSRRKAIAQKFGEPTFRRDSSKSKPKSDSGSEKPSLKQIQEYGHDPADVTGDPTVINVDGNEYYKIGENKWKAHSTQKSAIGSSLNDSQMEKIVNEGKQVKVYPSNKSNKPKNHIDKDLDDKQSQIEKHQKEADIRNGKATESKSSTEQQGDTKLEKYKNSLSKASNKASYLAWLVKSGKITEEEREQLRSTYKRPKGEKKPAAKKNKLSEAEKARRREEAGYQPGEIENNMMQLSSKLEQVESEIHQFEQTSPGNRHPDFDQRLDDLKWMRRNIKRSLKNYRELI